jgi:hypothetical protein
MTHPRSQMTPDKPCVILLKFDLDNEADNRGIDAENADDVGAKSSGRYCYNAQSSAIALPFCANCGVRRAASCPDATALIISARVTIPDIVPVSVVTTTRLIL